MGKRSTHVASVRRLNRKASSLRQISAASRNKLRGTTIVVSPRNSITSLIAEGNVARSFSRGALP